MRLYEIMDTCTGPGTHKTQQRTVSFYVRTWLENDVTRGTAQWQDSLEGSEM